MSTFTRARDVTTCDDCHEPIPGTSWRQLAAHTATHDRDRQLAARAVRAAAMRDQSPCEITVSVGQTWDNGDVKTAPITSRGLTAKTLRES